MSSGELIHYGVKGMKWGVRRKSSELDKPNSRYGQSKRANDRSSFGRGGEKRINRRMNKGMTYKKAVRREYGTTAFKGLAMSGSVIAYGLARSYGSVAAQGIAKKAETNRGRASAAATMGLPRNPTNGPSYSKKNRKNVYNISSL